MWFFFIIFVLLKKYKFMDIKNKINHIIKTGNINYELPESVNYIRKEISYWKLWYREQTLKDNPDIQIMEKRLDELYRKIRTLDRMVGNYEKALKDDIK